GARGEGQVRARAVLVALPMMAAGSLTAHQLAYRLVVPASGARARLLAQSGHAYLHDLPSLAALGAALLLAGMVLQVLVGRRTGRGRGRLAMWPFALCPPLAFALQEHLERLAASGLLPPTTAAQPT